MTNPVDLEQQLKDRQATARETVALSHGTMFRQIAEFHFAAVSREMDANRDQAGSHREPDEGTGHAARRW
jgi:hypothetical protein